MQKRFYLLIIFLIRATTLPLLSSSGNLDGTRESFSNTAENEKINTFSSFPKFYDIVTQDQLLHNFQLVKPIGGGGESGVYEVKDKTTRSHYALTVAYQGSLKTEKIRRGALIERLKIAQEFNPHLTKIYGYFWLEIRNHLTEEKKKSPLELFKNASLGNIINDFYKDDENALPYRHEAFLLELGEGDLQSQSFERLCMDSTVAWLMRCLNSHYLDEALIMPSDGAARNYIFLNTNDLYYQEKKMNSYDFWCYKVETYQIYLPTPSHIIKRIDYGGWLISKIGKSKEQTLARFARLCNLDENKFIELFCQKPRSEKILEIQIWKEKSVPTWYFEEEPSSFNHSPKPMSETKLNLRDWDFTFYEINLLKTLTHLTVLDLSYTNIKRVKGGGYGILNYFPNLVNLRLNATHTGFRDENVLKDINFQQMRSLIDLSYSANVIENLDLSCIGNIPNLQRLSLNNAFWRGEPNFSALKQISLEELNILNGSIKIGRGSFVMRKYLYHTNSSLNGLKIYNPNLRINY